MQAKKLTKEDLFPFILTHATLTFCLFSLVFFSIKQETGKAFMSLVSILYVCIPALAQRLFKFRMQAPLLVCVAVYTICPLLGYSYSFYYAISWWDDMLHAFAGVIFAMLGAYLPKVMSKKEEPSLSLCVFSAFFFSVAVAGLWELVEFSMDTFFGTDMQKDTLLFAMRPSYLLSELIGYPIGELAPLTEAQMQVNGQQIAGYVDLGLLDTMKDIFVETFGAAVYTIIYRVGGGKHFVFERVEEEEPAKELPSPLPEEERGAEVAATAEEE